MHDPGFGGHLGRHLGFLAKAPTARWQKMGNGSLRYILSEYMGVENSLGGEGGYGGP